VFGFTSLKIVGDAAVDNLVTDLELVLVSIAISHS
jgi:hypothetical protein